MPKYSQYSQLVGQPASNDRLLLRDVSDPSMAATGTTKEIEVADLLLGATDGKIVPLLVPIKNASNTTAIPKGTLLMATGATGDKVLAAPAVTDGSIAGIYIIGVSGEAIAPEAEGFAYSYAEIANYDTSAWPVGTVLWNDPAVAGGLSTTEPTAPNLKISVAIVTRQHASSGRLFVRETVSPKLKDLSDVHAPSPSDGQALVWNNANSRWEPGTVSASGDAATETISQVAHGFAVGDVIRHDGTIYAKAQADTAANAEAIGVVSAVPGPDSFTVVYGGRINGLSGLTAGEVYFLSSSVAGGLTITQPAISKPMLVATSTTSGVVVNYRGLTGGGGAGVLLSNTTVNLNSSMTTAQMQALIDAQPKNLNGYALTFQFADGTYTLTAQLVFDRFYGGLLNIYGNSANNTTAGTKNVVLNGASGAAAIRIGYCRGTAFVRYIQCAVFNAASSRGVYVVESTCVVEYCAFTNQSNSTTNGNSIETYGNSFVRIESCGFNRNNISVLAVYAVVQAVQNLMVVNSATGVRAAQSTVNQDGTITGTTARSVVNGGIISADAGNLL